jgi:hypothetical protein
MANTTFYNHSSDVQWCSVPLKFSQTQFLEWQILPNSWVKLLELPNPYSHDEALILCQHSPSKWLAWIPDHGEAILSVEQFCVPC